MQRPPRAKEAPILDQSTLTYITWSGLLIGGIALGVGFYYFDAGRPEDNYWQTMLFATLGFAQIGQAIGLRTSGASSLSLTSNPMLTFLTVLTIALQLAVIYLPFLEEFFLLRPLAPADLALAASAGLVLYAVVRLEGKWRLRRRVAKEGKGERAVAGA